MQIVGRGRMGSALSAVLAESGVDVTLSGRGATGQGAELVLLTVPDAAISEAARLIVPGPVVAHLSGATGLEPLGARDGFSLHPLTSVTGPGHRFEGVPAALAASSERGRSAANWLAERLGVRTFTVDDADRAAYHAAASLASNFLVTLEGVAEQLAATAGVGREALAHLVRESVENWVRVGAPDALTGPIARGDEETVARHRAAIAARVPEHLELFDALAAATRRLSEQRRGEI